MRRRAWRNNIRPAIAAAAIAIILVTLLVVKWTGTRRQLRDVSEASAQAREEIVDFQGRLAHARELRAALPLEERGHGPGGIRCQDERLFFEGPTSASAALDLITAADRAGFRYLSYDGKETIVQAKFPGVEVDGLAMRGKVGIVRWPVRFRLESTFPSAVDFLRRIAEAEPGFALDGVRLEVARDSQGGVRDRVVVSGLISSHWFQAVGDSDGE